MIRAGVIGWPVEHSLSPVIHGYWLKKYGIAGSYEILPVAPEDFNIRIKSLAADGFAGCNLTVPFKTCALDLMDDLSPRAQAIGAVNTVVVAKDGGLLGDNTDAYGYIKGLDHQLPNWRQSVKRAAIIGAGGAARAVIYGLLDEGLEEIAIYNRTRDKAQNIVEGCMALKHGAQMYAYSLDALAERFSGYDLIVNTSILGMAGQPELDLDLSDCLPETIISDIVYAPRETRLLKNARGQGLRVAAGLPMLVYQAAPGFEYWFGHHPEVTEDLIRAVSENLA